MSRENTETKTKIDKLLKDFGGKDGILQRLNDMPEAFFLMIDMYSKMSDLTPNQLLKGVCERCEIQLAPPIDFNNYHEACHRITQNIKTLYQLNQPTLANASILDLKCDRFIRTGDYLAHSNEIANFALKVAEFNQKVKTALSKDPKNSELKDLSKYCDKLVKKTTQLTTDVQKLQSKEAAQKIKQEQHDAKTLEHMSKSAVSPLKSKLSSKQKIAEEFLNHPINRDSSPLKTRNR